MIIDSVFSRDFAAYGKVLPGYDTAALCAALERDVPLGPGVDYVASQPSLEALPIAAALQDNAYGGMPIQIGWCAGRNTRLNCLEYHRDSELNIGSGEFILLLARLDELQNGRLHTDAVRAFRAPAGAVVELYATTLHYAPCSAAAGRPFRVAVVLPRGTNGPRPAIAPLPGNEEDLRLWACNKWLLAHPDSSEAAQGAAAALDGPNPDIAGDI